MQIKDYFYVPLIGFLICSLAIELLRLAAHRFKILDDPSWRKIHKIPTPRLGGLAIALGFMPAACVALINGSKLLGLWVGLLAALLLGLSDDIWGVHFKRKFYFQIVIGCLAYLLGYRIIKLDVGVFGNMTLGVFSLPFTVFWIISCMNAVNLVDGLDGLCVSIVSASIVCLIGLSGNVLLVALLASLVGFWVYNYHPASMFMGDSGTYFLGFLLSFFTIQILHTSDGSFQIFPAVLILGLPFLDMFLAIVRRWVKKNPIFSADEGHVHHCLLRRGFTVPQVMLLLMAAQIVFCFAAYFIYIGDTWQIVVSFVASLVVTYWLVSEIFPQFSTLNIGSIKSACSRTYEALR